MFSVAVQKCRPCKITGHTPPPHSRVGKNVGIFSRKECNNMFSFSRKYYTVYKTTVQNSSFAKFNFRENYIYFLSNPIFLLCTLVIAPLNYEISLSVHTLTSFIQIRYHFAAFLTFTYSANIGQHIFQPIFVEWHYLVLYTVLCVMVITRGGQC